MLQVWDFLFLRAAPSSSSSTGPRGPTCWASPPQSSSWNASTSSSSAVPRPQLSCAFMPSPCPPSNLSASVDALPTAVQFMYEVGFSVLLYHHTLLLSLSSYHQTIQFLLSPPKEHMDGARFWQCMRLSRSASECLVSWLRARDGATTENG
eukprot:GHVS01018147.1.p1 GENE.GHVS01018147.1~~GHVS01018147.1.p1  ORF type:complete len:165 (+),score=42.84 GHVS01018147.1:45-497(+)